MVAPINPKDEDVELPPGVAVLDFCWYDDPPVLQIAMGIAGDRVLLANVARFFVSKDPIFKDELVKCFTAMATRHAAAKAGLNPGEYEHKIFVKTPTEKPHGPPTN